MHKIILPIDTKSLYMNIYNDNLKGHTCTVATPIKQGKSINEQLNQIYLIPQQIDYEKHEKLVDELRKNSKSIVKINNVFLFNKIKVNNQFLKCDSNFCIYVKEEIDDSRAQYGRIKMHYPTSLKYVDLSIDNKKVLNTISSFLNDYAFIVESFEYDFDDYSLNFNIVIVGYNNIPYSKVFINNKGVGSKFNTIIKNNFDSYDMEIVVLKNQYFNADTNNYETFLTDARNKALEIVEEYLLKNGAIKIRNLSEEYPYSLFDIQYFINNELFYGLVRNTFTKKIYADLTAETNRFINLFTNCKIFIISEVMEKNVLNIYDARDLERFSTRISSIRLISKE